MSKLNKAAIDIALASVAVGGLYNPADWHAPTGAYPPDNRTGRRKGHYRNNSAQKKAQNNKAIAKRRKKNKAAKQARKITRK